MGLFSYLDARRLLARRVHRTSQEIRKADSQMPMREVIECVLVHLVSVHKPKREEAAILSGGLYRVIDVFSLCHLLADGELLAQFSFEDRLQWLGDSNNVRRRTYRVIDDELVSLGYKPLPDKMHSMILLDAANPETAAHVYAQDPEFRWAKAQQISGARRPAFS